MNTGRNNPMLDARGRCAALIASLLLAVACGCASKPMGERFDANVPAAQLRQNLAADFPVGMTEQQVRSKLDQVGVSDKYRMDYPKTDARPHVLLARLFQPGGFWIDDDDEYINWTDVSFVFSAQDTLDRIAVFEDGNRYLGGLPINPPKRPMAGRMERWPAPPPPPENPLEGAE